MSNWISGRTALRELDMSVARLRKKLSNAIEAADDTDGRSAEVRQKQVEGYRRLAEMRINEIEDVDIGMLDRLHKRARALIDDHADYVRREAQALDDAAEAIGGL